MERTKKEIVIEQSTKLRWQKTGGGSLRFGNRIIKPGEVFEANLDELPKAFMDTLICLDKADLQKVQDVVRRETQTPEILYRLAKSKTAKTLWDVINAEGKPINEVSLEKVSAEELLAAVNA